MLKVKKTYDWSFMTDQELKDINEFMQENPVRNKYLPIFYHICQLKPKGFSTEEWIDKDDRPAIRFFIEAENDRFIEGRVSYEWWDGHDPDPNDKIVFELWWDEENYGSFDSIVKTQNWLTLLIKQGMLPLHGLNMYDSLKKFEKSEELMPIPQ